jgi:hypothetical protein
MASFCPKCGKEVEYGATFCTSCGSSISGQPGNDGLNQNTNNNSSYERPYSPSRGGGSSLLSAIRICGIMWAILAIIWGILYFIFFAAAAYILGSAGDFFGIDLGIVGVVILAYGLITMILAILSAVFAIITCSHIKTLSNHKSAFAFFLVSVILALVDAIIVLAVGGDIIFGVLLLVAAIIGIVFVILFNGEKSNFYS